jgi:hypothetical protein
MFHPPGRDGPIWSAFSAEMKEFAADSVAFKLLT